MKVLIKNNTIRVTFISWWEMEDDVDKTRFNTSDRFLLNFLEKIFDCKTEIVSNNDECDVIFVSVFNDFKEDVIDYLDNHNSTLKIFFTGENLERRFDWYDDYLLDHVDIAIGFKKFNSPKSLRFPLWLTSTFDDKTFYDLLVNNRDIDLNKYFKKIDFDENKRGFCTLVTTWNGYLDRELAFNELNDYKPVNSGGEFLNNSSMLADLDQNITAYYNKFNFNICLENSGGIGYTTEKIFNALYAGTIPIYSNEHEPESDILNQKRIIIWENENTFEKIKYYDNNYREIFDLDIFNENANQLIFKFYTDLIFLIKQHIHYS